MPGQQAQVDFADFQIQGDDGKVLTIYCFVMVLGYSRHMYIEFIDKCTLPKFLACHQHAFGFFGGANGTGQGPKRTGRMLCEQKVSFLVNICTT